MNNDILKGDLLDDNAELSLNDLCQACAGSTDWVLELVAEGVIEPSGQQQTAWRFSARCLQRAHTAMRLQRDLHINLSGVALAIDLLEEIEALQARLMHFEPLDKP
ncbi:MAG: chaperone modulator CbpM [Cycloclasticus sp.]|nr:chaperone modulator CbpM [Cycloclasticus sp.]MBQ0790309.1 chaperone modulator CbpM [Cycloclasticus sp.]